MSQERFTGTTQAPGSDGSSEQFHSAGPATGASTPAEDAGVGNSDGVHTPKLYSYVLTTGGMTNTSNQGTICSKDTSTMTAGNISTDAKALAVERSNMRFHQMLAKLNSIENIHSFEVTTETVPAATGVPVLESTFTVTYLRQPVHYNAVYTPGELTVQHLAAEGITFDGTDATQMRHVWKPANVVEDSGTGGPDGPNTQHIPQIVHRENVTAVKFATVATLYGNMTCDETIVNPTNSLP
jgi:hypothetical protein